MRERVNASEQRDYPHVGNSPDLLKRLEQAEHSNWPAEECLTLREGIRSSSVMFLGQSGWCSGRPLRDCVVVGVAALRLNMQWTMARGPTAWVDHT